MAFQMVHLEVAYRLLQKWDWIKYDAEFILGSVSPDSVHMDENYQVEQKIKSHLFEKCGPWGDTQDYEQWIQNMRSYWQANGKNCKDEKTKSYIAGVIVHCLTDYSNDLNVWRRLQKQYMPPMSLEEFKAEYYPETQNMDVWLYQNSKNTKEIFELFSKGEALELNGLLKSENIEKQKQHMMFVQYDREKIEPLGYKKYMTKDFLLNFLDETVRLIEDEVEQSGFY